MADQIIELLELIEKDPAWLPEFYSAVANSDVIVPMILPPGRIDPVPVWANRHTSDTIVFDPELNDYVPCAPSSIDSTWYCLLYSNPDAYKSVKPILETKYKRLGHIVDPVVQNGRQIINIFCKNNNCAAINLFTSKSPQGIRRA